MKVYELFDVLALEQHVQVIDFKSGEILGDFLIELHTPTDEFDQKIIAHVFVKDNVIVIAVLNE